MGDFDGYRALSFDCYGTLIDWESGIAAELRPWATSAGLDVGDEELVAAFGAVESDVETERPGDLYPDVLAEVMRRIGSRFGAAVDDDTAARFGGSVARWPAFADSAEALARLKERFALIIVSNVDRASFAASNAELGVEFDMVVCAEDVGSYKPAPAHFDTLLARIRELGIDRAELVHVAESLFHDHQVAQAYGLPSVWIHRRHGREGHGATRAPAGEVRPRWRFESMAAFADAAVGPRRA